MLAIGGALVATQTANAQRARDGSANARTVLRVLVLVPDTQSEQPEARLTAMANGLHMGAAEAERAVGLVGQSLQIVMQKSVLDSVVVVARAALQRQVFGIVVGGASEEACRGLRDLAARAQVLYVNTHCEDDALREINPVCEKSPGKLSTLHVAPSRTQLDNGLLAGVPDSVTAGSVVVAWHPSLVRFGAGELNARYRMQFGTEMTADAWLGWAAIKVVVDVALRMKTADIGVALAQGGAVDAHKGRALRIRVSDGQLVQPLYLVAASTNPSARLQVYELPDMRVPSPAPSVAEGTLKASCG